MSIDTLKQALPAYAKDLKLNLGSVLNAPELSKQQAWGAALSAAIAARNPQVLEAISAEAGQHLSEEAANAAKAAAAVMSMNNIYYRFTHLASNKAYRSLPAKLRMNVIANPGVDQLDFELWSLGVSAINGCGMCIDSHEQVVLKKGATKEMVQAVVRIASVVQAVAVTLEAERTLSGEEKRQAA